MEPESVSESSSIIENETDDKKVDIFLAFMKGKKAVPIVEIRKYTNMSYATIRSIAKNLGYTEEKEYVSNETIMPVIKA